MPLLLPILALVSGARAQDEAGEIFVTTAEPGLPITLDGQDTGEVSPSLLKDVPAGRHTVEVRLECAHFYSEVEVKPLQITRVTADPVEGTGTLAITSEPSGALVYLGEEVLGATPLETTELPCGEDHSLRVEAEGYVSLQRTLRVPAFRTTELDFSLDPLAFGVLVISVEPLDARIYLDDLKVAEGPVTLDSVQNGPHRLLISREGYINWEKDFYVEADRVNRLEVALEEGTAAALDAIGEGDLGSVLAGGEEGADAPVDGGAAQPAAAPEPLAVAAAQPAAAQPPVGAGSAEASWGRLALNGAVTAAGLGAGAMGLSSYLKASEAFDRYLLVDSDAEAELIYEDEVVPMQRRAIMQGAVGGVLLAGSAALWLTTDYTVAATPQSIHFAWRW